MLLTNCAYRVEYNTVYNKSNYVSHAKDLYYHALELYEQTNYPVELTTLHPEDLDEYKVNLHRQTLILYLAETCLRNSIDIARAYKQHHLEHAATRLEIEVEFRRRSIHMVLEPNNAFITIPLYHVEIP